MAPRPREPVLARRPIGRGRPAGCMLADVYRGRNMAGVRPGEIKKLLVLETLPKPVNFTGGMEPLSYGGTFTLERVLGTVPVEADGSAYFEVPALRSAVLRGPGRERPVGQADAELHDASMPGETAGCVGCHEQRDASAGSTGRAPGSRCGAGPAASSRSPACPTCSISPATSSRSSIATASTCHDAERREGGVVLSGDRGPIFSLSYLHAHARGAWWPTAATARATARRGPSAARPAG